MGGKSPYTVREVASLTKIMTFYTTLKIIEDNDLDVSKIYFRVSK